tara:strand:+ start:414 stop:623 length:210 start_codon:yes stop_codon:yes gene_type:complete
MPLLLIIKNAIGAIAMYYLKKNAPELVYDASVAGLDKLAKMTDTKIDDDAVNKLKHDRDEYIKIIKGFL